MRTNQSKSKSASDALFVVAEYRVHFFCLQSDKFFTLKMQMSLYGKRATWMIGDCKREREKEKKTHRRFCMLQIMSAQYGLCLADARGGHIIESSESDTKIGSDLRDARHVVELGASSHRRSDAQ